MRIFRLPAALSLSSSRLLSASASHRITRTLRTMAIPDYETILKGKYPAKAHAKRVADYIRERIPDASGVLYLESRATKMIEDNDEAEPFRQRRYFNYLTGVPLADSQFVYDIDADKSTLFIPAIDPEHVMWAGLPPSPEELLAKYDVDDVQYAGELNASLAHAGTANKKATVFAIANQVSDQVTFLEFANKDFSLLKKAIEDTRVVKDEYEIALIAKANAVSSEAHRKVLERVRNAGNEAELEAVFLGHCIANGAREQAYHSIVASGRAAATLHYTPNNAPIGGKLNLLLDAGAEWACYASDITRTFPINGKFTTESRAIYDIVLKMQLETIAVLKEGVRWDDVHELAHKIAIDGLLELGILQGDKEEILASRTSNAFFPHGLGHYLGMDTHDTGGNPNYEDADRMFRYLRVRGALPAGSVVTVEPGVYFSEFLIAPYLEDAKHSKFINKEVLDKYWDVGGVRIEDNIVITKDGSLNLTTAVKDVAEMEKIIASS